MTDTDLTLQMIAQADEDNLPPDHDMRTKAKAFTEAALGFYNSPPTHTVQQFMRAWAQARTTWCNYTGASLI